MHFRNIMLSEKDADSKYSSFIKFKVNWAIYWQGVQIYAVKFFKGKWDDNKPKCRSAVTSKKEARE